MKESHATPDEAAQAIERDIRAFYAARGREGDASVANAVTSLQNIHRRNVFPV